MTGAELIAEKLARPSVLLLKKGPEDRFAAVWGGDGPGAPPEGDFRYWLTVDCSFFPKGLGVTKGCLSIYTDEDDCESGVAMLDKKGKLTAKRGSVKLYAHEARSLPPTDAVFEWEDSPAVKKWLKSNQWKPDWDDFIQEYDELYQSECPIYTGKAFAVLGGWHFSWPEENWPDRLNRPLLVWTFKDSEPWVEVWGGKKFEVVQRAT